MQEPTCDNAAVEDTSHETKPNELLFGKNLTENLKQAIMIGKEAQILLKKSTAPDSLKNLKAPPHQNQNKSQAVAGMRSGNHRNPGRARGITVRRELNNRRIGEFPRSRETITRSNQGAEIRNIKCKLHSWKIEIFQ